MFGKHRHDTVDEVDTCGPALCFAVERCVGSDIVCDVGYVYADLVVAVFELFDRKSVIEVFCISRVDGECDGLAHVHAACDLVGSDASVDFLGR